MSMVVGLRPPSPQLRKMMIWWCGGVDVDEGFFGGCTVALVIALVAVRLNWRLLDWRLRLMWIKKLYIELETFGCLCECLLVVGCNAIDWKFLYWLRDFEEWRWNLREGKEGVERNLRKAMERVACIWENDVRDVRYEIIVRCARDVRAMSWRELTWANVNYGLG